MKLLRATRLALVAWCFIDVAAAAAQTMPREPDASSLRVRIGPLGLRPSIGLTNAGVDTNVFYEPDALKPERDVTLTVTAQSDYWLRMGRTWATGQLKEDLIWYQKFTDERSANQNYTLYWLVPLNRLTVSVGGNWLDAKERPGFEIDARTRRRELAGGGVVELRAFSKTFIGGRGQRRKVEFDQGEEFRGRDLQNELNRTRTEGGLKVRHELTPLTSIGFEVAKAEDRFEFSTARDSDSTQATGSVTFAPAALISGSAQFGYRRFTPRDPLVPGYRGSTANVSLSHVARGSTKLNLSILRDVQYSFDLAQPYYVQTGFDAMAGQQIYGPVDVEARFGRHGLAYRDRGGSGNPSRTDHIRTVGGGVGYRLGRDLRVGFNVDRQERESDVLSLDYSGVRYGLAVTYGL